MAMTDALSIYLENGTTKAYLKNVLAGIFENYQKEALSARFKSKNANLNRAAGSYEFKRFANSTVRDYGTARTAPDGSSSSSTIIRSTWTICPPASLPTRCLALW